MTRKDYEIILQKYDIEHQNEIDEATKQFNQFLLSSTSKISQASVNT